MSTVPNPRTWTVGELLTAAKLNTDLRDGLNYLLAPPRAQLYRSTNQSIGSPGFFAIQWDAEIIDTDGGHSTSTNNSRYTAQTAGWYDVSAMVTWLGDSTAGYRATDLLINGTGSGVLFDMSTVMSDTTCAISIAGKIFLNVSDYAEVRVLQSSGSTRALTGGQAYTHVEYFWRSK